MVADSVYQLVSGWASPPVSAAQPWLPVSTGAEDAAQSAPSASHELAAAAPAVPEEAAKALEDAKKAAEAEAAALESVDESGVTPESEDMDNTVEDSAQAL